MGVDAARLYRALDGHTYRCVHNYVHAGSRVQEAQVPDVMSQHLWGNKHTRVLRPAFRRIPLFEALSSEHLKTFSRHVRRT